MIFGALCMRFFCDFVIFVCDFFVISREVYEKKSVICPSGSLTPPISSQVINLLKKHLLNSVTYFACAIIPWVPEPQKKRKRRGKKNEPVLFPSSFSFFF